MSQRIMSYKYINYMQGLKADLNMDERRIGELFDPIILLDYFFDLQP